MCETGCEGVKLIAKDLVAGWMLWPGNGPSLPWLKSVHTARFSTTYRAPPPSVSGISAIHAGRMGLVHTSQAGTLRLRDQRAC